MMRLVPSRDVFNVFPCRSPVPVVQEVGVRSVDWTRRLSLGSLLCARESEVGLVKTHKSSGWLLTPP